MNLFTLVATLGLDTSEFDKKMGSAVGQGKKAGNVLMKGLATVGKAAGAIAVTSAAAYVGIVKTAVDKVAELEQNVGAAIAVWGEGLGEQQRRIAMQAAENVGLSTSQYLEMSNKMGSLMQGMGFDTREAFALSTQAIQRTADVASIMNIPIENAMEAINGLAKGNFTMMDNLGVAMNETALANYALEQGIKKSTSKMSTQEKVALALQMYMDKTAYATGNFAKEAEGLAGATTILKASWANLLDGSGTPEDFGNQLVNYIDTYMDVLKEVAPRIAKSIGVVLSTLGDRTREWLDSVGGVRGALRQGLDWTLGQLDLPPASTIVQQVSDWWTGLEGENVYEKIKEAISIGVSKVDAPPLSEVVDNITTWWKDTAVPAIETAMSTYAEEFAIPLIADVLNLSDEDAEALLTAYQEFFGSIGELASTVVGLIGEVVNAIAGLFSSGGGEYEGSGIAKALTMLVQGLTGVTNAANTALTAVKDFFAYFNGRSSSPSGAVGSGGLLVQSIGAESVDTGPTFGEQMGQWAEGVWNDTRNLLGIPGRPGANNSPNINVINNISSVAQNPADIGFATQQSLNRLRFGA